MWHRITLGLFALCLSVFAETPPLKIAVYKFSSSELSLEQNAELSKFLTDELRKYPEFEVMDWENVSQVIGFVGAQQKLSTLSANGAKADCTGDKCFAELGNRLGVERMVVGSVNKIGTRFLVNLSMQDIENVKVLGTSKAQIRGDIGEILDSLAPLLERVVGHPPQKRLSFVSSAPSNPGTQIAMAPTKGNSVWKTSLRYTGLGLGLLGIGYAIYGDQQGQKAYDAYRSLPANSENFDSQWQKVEDAKLQRLVGGVLGGVGLLGFGVSYAF